VLWYGSGGKRFHSATPHALPLSPVHSADCGLEITRIAQVGHKGGQGNRVGGKEVKARGRRGGRAGAAPIGEEEGGPPWRARASVASLLSCFFFFLSHSRPPPAPLRSRAPPAVCALQQRGRGVHVYVRLCVLCGACAQLPLHRQGARFHGPRSHGPPSFSRTPAPPPRSRPSPPHSQRPRHPHTHTHPSSLHTTPTPLFRVPAPPCAPSSTPTRPAFRPTPARPTVWAPRAPSPSWCPPAP
jgi:hypothetical protein